VYNPTNNHYGGKGHLFYDIRKRWFVVKAFFLMFDNVTDHDNFLKFLEAWHDDDGFTLEIIRKSDLSKTKLDGVNTSMPASVAKPGLKGIHGSPGDGQKYFIKSIIFEQTGAIT
jgi:hypothetical protein